MRRHEAWPRFCLTEKKVRDTHWVCSLPDDHEGVHVFRSTPAPLPDLTDRSAVEQWLTEPPSVGVQWSDDSTSTNDKEST